MQRETALGGVAAAVVLSMVLGAALVPDVTAAPREDVRPSHFDIHRDGGSIRTVAVPGRTVTLRIEERIAHDGGVAENVTVEMRAVDERTGLLEDQQRVDLGTVDGERELPVATNLTVERSGGYHIETFVYENAVRKAHLRRTIGNVGSLTPEYARSTVEFHRFQSTDANLPTITTSIVSNRSGRTTINVSAYLKNDGNADAGDVTLHLRARQAESNVVADQARVSVGSIRAGRTVTPGAELTVPSGYNYWIDALLSKDGVVIDTASEPANLDPHRVLRGNETREEVDFDAGDFTGSETERPRDDPTPMSPSGGSGPGLGVGAAVVALFAAGLLAGRRNHD